MKSKTALLLKVLYVLSWIIFVGLCVEAGGFFFNSFFTLLYNPNGAKHFWQQADLSSLYWFDRGYFVMETSLVCIVAVVKAILFYQIIKILHEKKLNMSQPFSNEAGRFVFRMSYLSLLTGVLCLFGARYAAWFTTQGVKMPDIQQLDLGGADVWLFMGVSLFVIALVFKRGIEIQTENELTV